MSTTTTAPAQNPLLSLLDFVPSPILLFNAEGRVMFSNQAAKKMSCRPAILLGADPNAVALVRDIAAGKPVLHLHMRVDALSDNGSAQLQCVCAPRPIGGMVAMSVAEVAEEESATPAPQGDAGQRLSLQEIMELIKGDLTPPIKKVLAIVPTSVPPEWAEHLRQLQDRVDRLLDLVNVFGDDVLIGDDRILLPDMVRNVAQELSPLTQRMDVTFIIDGDRADLPPVYGSSRLIRRAVYECLANAIQHARRDVSNKEKVAVGVHFRASGKHLLVNIEQMGAISVAALERHAANIFRAAPAQGDSPPPQPPRLKIGLPLTQRILQLHGGRLRIEEDEVDGLSVKLELPTGAPLRSSHQLDMLQAQIYAEDLSKLMARTRQRSTT